MATEKTSNDYREERKARLAKAAKKNSKKSHKISGKTMSKKTKSAFAGIVAVALVILIAAFACNESGVFERMKKIETVSGDSFSAVEYEYYYRYTHNYYYSMSQQYDSYYQQTGYGYYYTGFDTTKLPEDQEYPGTDYTLEDGSKATWKQYFEYTALNQMQQYQAMADLAEADKDFKLDSAVLDEALGQIDEMKKQLKEQAETNGTGVVSFNKYLRSAYGKGMSQKVFEDIVVTQTIASEYSNYLMENRADAYTDAELEEVYKKDTSSYDCVDFRVFSISPVTPKLDDDATTDEKNAATKQSQEDAKAKAEEMFGKITDEASFIKLAEQYATKDQKDAADYTKSETTLMAFTEKSTIEGSFTEEAIKWLYNKNTPVGEKKLFDVSGTQYIMYMVKPAYRDNNTLPVDVRHILYQFDSEAKDAEADKRAKKAEADATLTAINTAQDKLDKFLEICEKDSDDTGSAANGGLIEYLAKGKYVKAFEEWSLDPARKEGDVAVIETEYGYHVMYFVTKHDKPMWKITISNTLASESVDKDLDEAIASDNYKVAAGNKVVASTAAKIYDDLLNTYYVGVSKVEPTTKAPSTTAAAK
ncbi:MAG: peptidylprolyl isomerase [Clostridia bacterium]|nr:peptidylprolyl isomerase [Clostridia bacterium]